MKYSKKMIRNIVDTPNQILGESPQLNNCLNLPCRCWRTNQTIGTGACRSKSRASSIIRGRPEETFEFAAEKHKHVFKTFQSFRNNQPTCIFPVSHILILLHMMQDTWSISVPCWRIFRIFLIFVDVFGSFKTHEQSLRSHHCCSLTSLRKKQLEKAEPFRIVR